LVVRVDLKIVLVAITGANGHLGIRLIEKLSSECEIRAVVRSESARQKILKLHPKVDVRIVNYTASEELAYVLVDCDVVVHLVGIIKESRTSTFKEAHERSCESLAEAVRSVGVRRIVYLSIVGSVLKSNNLCLKSKAMAEKILEDSGVEVEIIKVPMVLGEGDFASFALRKNATSKFPFTFRAASLEQPIYAGDVINAIRMAITKPDLSGVFNLAGAESVTRMRLIMRAAKILGTSPIVVSLPIQLGFLLAWVLEWLPNPPISRAMLGVLDHDDQIDIENALGDLELELTPLDETLRKVLLSAEST